MFHLAGGTAASSIHTRSPGSHSRTQAAKYAGFTHANQPAIAADIGANPAHF